MTHNQYVTYNRSDMANASRFREPEGYHMRNEDGHGIIALPQAIRSVRKGLRLTQAQFAKAILVARNTVARYESGLITPSRQSLLLILRFAEQPQQRDLIIRALHEPSPRAIATTIIRHSRGTAQ